MEIHPAHQLESLILVQIIILNKLKLKILPTFCKHPTRGEGRPSWMCQKDQDEGPNSQNHRLAMVTTITRGEGLVWTKTEPDSGSLIY